MKNKRVAAFVIVWALSVAVISATATATITDVVCRDRFDDPLPAERWSFGYDLQAVTLTIPIYATGRELYGPEAPHFVWITGTEDSLSVLTVTQNVVNQTGGPLTSYSLVIGNTVGNY